MRRLVRAATACLLVLAAGIGAGGAARADQAPLWESPVGLIPGQPGGQVRMAGETVDVEVVERGDEIHAVVQASFTMVNDGPDVVLKVGFPASTTSLFDELAAPDASGRRLADAPARFSPQALRAFRVSVDGRELRSWRQDVPAAAQAGFGADWLMWEMAYPAGQTTRVDVSYEQVLTDRAGDRVVQPMYVLRTGALWSGPIGDATITLRAPDGGALVGGPELYMRSDPTGAVATYPRADQVYGPADAADASSSQVTWRFREFEPTRDVGATYVRRAAWQAFGEADRAITDGEAVTAGQLRQAADAALAILGGPSPCGQALDQLCLAGPHRVPRGLVELLAQTARERARRAVELAPDDADALLTYGDLEYWFAMPHGRHHGELGCWPSEGVEAYERAAAGGAPGAGPRLAGLQASARQVRFFGEARIDTCSGQPDQRLDVELVKATIEEGNSAWSEAIARGGTAERYASYFAGRWLDERTAEVAALRRDRQHREATLDQLDFAALSFDDPATASVETVERWQDRTYSEGGGLVRDASGPLRQRYELRKLDGQWKIVDAVVVRG
jgi:hypothetical protein